MKTTPHPISLFLLVLGLATLAASAAVPRPDLVPAEKRQATVATGLRLSKAGDLPAVAADVASPFSPPDFDRPLETTITRPGGAPPSTAPGAAQSPAGRPSSAREVIEAMAPLIPSSGTIERGGERQLMVAGRGYRVGESFEVSVGDGPKYRLEITRITATDYTLRYQGEEKTRPTVIRSSSK
jgi:hypothetical protein